MCMTAGRWAACTQRATIVNAALASKRYLHQLIMPRQLGRQSFNSSSLLSLHPPLLLH